MPALPEAQRQIIDLLESEARNWTTSEIIEATEKSKQAVNNLLSKMKDSGLIERPFRGQWKAKSTYTNTPPLRKSVFVYSENPPETILSKPPEAPAVPAGAPVEELAIW
jgi:DNA-binding transcriptional ArsR family regulator